MILAAVGTLMAGISYVQCCIPISIFGFILSFFAYRKSVESGNELAKNLSIVGMILAALQIVFVILIAVAYFGFLIWAMSTASSDYTPGSYNY